MKRQIANRLASAICACLIMLSPRPALAQDVREQIEAVVRDYLATHPDELGEIVKGYFIKHPEAIGQILAEVIKHRPSTNTNATGALAGAAANAAADRSATVAGNAAALFASPHQVTLGNPDGNVTLVEFFDYSCGFCKRAMPDLLTLLKDDTKLKIVLKELPILGPGSMDAARVAVAVRMQDLDGQKYLAFHRELLGNPGPASREKALAVATDLGLDMTRLAQDMENDEITSTIKEDVQLASAVGITGTPGYVIGKQVVFGAVGIAELKRKIDAARETAAHEAAAH
jgi:protein-disulfide isomerase